MTALIQPQYTIGLGSQRFSAQAIEVRVTLELAPVVDLLEITFPAAVTLSAGTGDEATLRLINDGAEEDVFTGTIEAIHRGFETTRVRALNAGGSLARFRPAATYEQVSAGDVVQNLCDEGGVDAGDVADGVDLAFYVADPSRNAWEHVARVAGWSGAVGRVSAAGAIETLVLNATSAELALRFGRELTAIDQEARSSSIDSFTVAGESGAGTTSAPEALRPSTDFFGGKRPDGPSASARWSSAPALRTAAAAASAGAARQRAYGASRLRGHFDSFLLPRLRPGSVVEIQELPDGLARDVIWLRRVRHIVGPRGGVTRADFYKGGNSFNPLALLGSIAGLL
jgi:hypothetical protein